MSVKNIHHKFSIAVESDTPQGRAIGILKIAEVFEAAGIHLSSDLNVETSRDLARCGDYTAELVQNTQLRAVMVESTRKAKAIERDTAGLYPVPYPALRVLTPEEEIRGTSFLERTLGSAKEALKSFDEQVADVQPGKKLGNSALSGAHGGGTIPGYEHNPMAKAEYFGKIDSQAVFVPSAALRPDHRLLPNTWPFPLPVGLKPNTSAYSTDGEVAPCVHLGYTVYGLSTSADHVTDLLSIQFQDGPVNPAGLPNGVRVEDLLAICSDHLGSLAACGQAEQSQIDANKSILKALHHLHGLTSLKHLNPTDTPDDSSRNGYPENGPMAGL